MFAPYLKIIISSVVVYLFITLAIRVFGKKELAQLSILDLVFIFLISNAVQNAMVGENTTLAGGLTAAGALFLTNFIFKWILFRFPRIGRWVQGESIMLIHHGKLLASALEKVQITREELMEAVREHGVRSIAKVDLAIFEVDGNISILSDKYQKRSSHKQRRHRIWNDPAR